MRSLFWTGLLMLLPIFITYLIITTILGFITSPFLFFTDQILTSIFAGFLSRQVIHIASHLLIVAYVIGFIFLIGYLADTWYSRAIVQYSERLIKKIPIIKTIYGSATELTQSFFSRKKETFSQVVLVPYPHKGAKAFGFVTPGVLEKDKITVFVSGAPNPSVGYMLTFDRNEVEILDLTVADAFKIIVSCGVSQNEQK